MVMLRREAEEDVCVMLKILEDPATHLPYKFQFDSFVGAEHALHHSTPNGVPHFGQQPARKQATIPKERTCTGETQKKNGSLGQATHAGDHTYLSKLALSLSEKVVM